MKRYILMVALVVLLAVAVLVMSVATAKADTYTIQIGSNTYTVVKPNVNAAVYTDGTRLFVTAIGASITGGSAQPNAVPGTINGFPTFFILPPSP